MSCRILLGDQTEFYTNSPIFGHLELCFAREHVVRQIVITLECLEESEFVTHEKKHEDSVLALFIKPFKSVGRVLAYFDEYKFLRSQIIVIGRQLFPFTLYIPKEVPPSMQLTFGEISYMLRARCNLHLFQPIECVSCINVISPLCKISRPLHAEVERKVRDNWLLMRKGRVQMKVDLSTNCFISGELVELKVEVLNFTRMKVHHLRFVFTKTLTIYTTKPKRKHKDVQEKLFEFISEGVDPYKRSVSNIQVRVPKTVEFYNLDKSELFKNTFILSVYGEMGFGNTIHVDFLTEMVHTKWLSMEKDPRTAEFIISPSIPIVALDAEEAFEELTKNEKMYIYHLSQASWVGTIIALLQCSLESGPIFIMLHKLFCMQNPYVFRAVAKEQEFTEEEISAFFAYTCGIFANHGNFRGVGKAKFVPDIEVHRLEALLKVSSAWNFLNPIWQKFQSRIYDLSPGMTHIGYPPVGCNSFMSKNCTPDDNNCILEWMEIKEIEVFNTRLFKTATIDHIWYEIRLAASEKGEVLTAEGKHTGVNVTKGDYYHLMGIIAGSLHHAARFTQDTNQFQTLNAFADFFITGCLQDHKEGTRCWMKSAEPNVESYIGFSDHSSDPGGVRCKFESFVGIADRTMTAKLGFVLDKFDEFLRLLPWPKQFEKDKFITPIYAAYSVITYAFTRPPTGMLLPGLYDDIRRVEGSKSITMSNAIAASSEKLQMPFLSASDENLVKSHYAIALEIKLMLHKLLGHQCGKLLAMVEEGVYNYPEDLTDPISGKVVKSAYQLHQTYKSVFGELAETFEEARAELVSLFLCFEKSCSKIFGYCSENANDLIYVIFVTVIWDGIVKGLKVWSPSVGWTNAYLQSKFVIAQVLIEAGVAKVTQPTEDALLITLDRAMLFSIGRKTIGDFLLKVQIFKATANFVEAEKLYAYYSKVEEPWLSWRTILIKHNLEDAVFVQPNVLIYDKEVVLETYDDSMDGLIMSWVERFKFPNEIYNAILELVVENEKHFN